MFNLRNILTFRRTQIAAPAPVAPIQARYLPMAFAIRQASHHTFVVTDTGEMVIDRNVGSDHIELAAVEVRTLRNLLSKADVRTVIGAPIKAQKQKNQPLSGPELLVYYEDAASIDPGFAVPTDADLAELFQQHYRAVPEPGQGTYTDNFAYFKGLEPDDISA